MVKELLPEFFACNYNHYYYNNYFCYHHLDNIVSFC